MNDEILTTYEDLLKTIWDRVVPTLGVMSTVTIFKRAISITEKKHPIIGYLKVGDTGISFEELKKNVASGPEGGDEGEMRDSFKELIASLFDILAKLTGSVIVSELLKEVEKIDEKT